MTETPDHRDRNRHGDILEHAHTGLGHGGRFATIISAFALLFSGYSFYESVLRAPEFAVYVPPRIAYTDPDQPTSPFEVFIIPVTIANDGARSGTVLSIDLKVTNKATGQTKHFYSAQTGPWRSEPERAFAPISLAGRTSEAQAIQFFPRVEETVPRITDLEGGQFDFELTLNIAASKYDGIPLLYPRTRPLDFTMEMGQMDYRRFNRTGTMALWTKNAKPAGTDQP